MIVTIDGSSGSGKSSAARGLAARLGFEVLDTGAMYRAVALAMLRDDLVETDLPGLERLLERVHIELPPGRVLLNGEDVTEVIRTPEMSQAASRASIFSASATSPVLTALIPLASSVSAEASSATGWTFHSSVSRM